MPELEVNNVTSDSEKGTETKEFTYDEAVELTGHGRYNYRQLAACSMIMLAASLDMFAHSMTVAAATCDLELTVWSAGVLASAPFAGLISALPWGYYADTRGRRKTLLIATTAGFIFAAATSLAPTWGVLFGLKLLGCVFSTAAFTINMTYLGECTPGKYRSRYLFITNTANLGAEIVCYSLAYCLLPLTFITSLPWLGITFRPWRLYCLLLSIPLGLGALMMVPLVESPKFLAARGEGDRALEVLKTIYESNGGRREDYVVKHLSKVSSHSPSSFWSSLLVQTVPLFKPPLLYRTLQLFFLVAVTCSTNNVFVMWYPTMVNIFFNSMNVNVGKDQTFCSRVVANMTTEVKEGVICNDVISPNTLYSGLILGTLFTCLNLLVAALASHRRTITMLSYAVSATCLVLVNQISNPIGNLIAFTLVQSTAIGIGTLASYVVDLYPTAHRGLAWSVSMMVGRLTTLSGLNIVGAALTTHCTATFYCWAFYVLCALVLAMLLPTDRTTLK